MKFLFWRRKPKQDDADAARTADLLSAMASLQPAPRTPVATAERVDRSRLPTRPLAMPPEVRDAVLRFAVDTLMVSGAKVRIEAEDQISATLPDGTSVRYTTSLARARDDEETQLLVQGGAVLSDLVDRCAESAAFGALALTERVDPVGAARAAVAEPRAGCERCGTASSGAPLDACAECPLRERRLVLRGMGRLSSGSVVRQWTAWSVELTYEVAYSDRQGRRTEWVRLAFDMASGTPRSVLDPDALRSARPADPPPDLIAGMAELQARAERALAPRLEAGAAFLRQRSERDFRDRLADLESTATRMQRETPEQASQIAASLTAEIERLREVFAVDVEAHLHSICCIATPSSDVTFRRRSGSALTVTVDLGRGELIPPACASCGNAVASGHVCEQGHITCTCCSASTSTGTPCAVCAGKSAPAKSARHKRQPPASADAGLNLEQVREMSDETWREFAGWLIEMDGVRLERAAEHGAIVLWHGREAESDTPVVAAALRPRVPFQVSGEDVRRAVAAAGATARMRLLSTAPASDEAASEARRLGVNLTDGDALARLLETLATSQASSRDTELAAVARLAATAANARDAMLADLAALEEALTRAANTRRATGRTAIASAAATATAARKDGLRALLAWDTLVGEWLASFDERAGREGTLVILSEAARFTEMAERASHLRVATLAALDRLASTPGTGDLGYGAWRKAVVEELTARCESCRWRVMALDPAHWDDFATAHDIAALERATSASTSAGHVAARVAKTYGDLAQRARL